MRFAILSSVAVLLLSSPASRAGDAISGDAAFLFAYVPKNGQEEQFAAGYRQHLEWHRQNRDPLPWYGWYVASGERVGMFVDGSFGISFSAFDNRVKPAEDGANFRRTTAPHGGTAYRKILRFMPELSTAARLEDRRPSAAIEVAAYVVRPGKAPVFESCLERLATTLQRAEPIPELTVYKQLSGGAQPAYLLMFPRDGYAYFAANTALPDALVREHFDADEAARLLAMFAESVLRVRTETWRYAEDMSYFPAE